MAVIRENEIGTQVIESAISVHSALGPGLLESAYEAAMAFELASRGLRVERQVPIDVIYRSVSMGLGYRADLLVESCVLVELKSVEAMNPIFLKQTMSYLKLGGGRLGFLINFNVALVKHGINRIANGLPD